MCVIAASRIGVRCWTGWKTNGLSARKKVHELRKLFGDAIVKREGIFAGSAQLRHSTIQMTANHYTDPRQRAALPVDNLFSEKSSRRSIKSRRSLRKSVANGHRYGVTIGNAITYRQ